MQHAAGGFDDPAGEIDSHLAGGAVEILKVLSENFHKASLGIALVGLVGAPVTSVSPDARHKGARPLRLSP